MLLLNQQHWPRFSGHLVTGEHAPVVLWLSLFVVGVLTTVLDVHLWSSLAKRSPSTASTPVTASTVLPVAAGKSLPTALPVPAEKSSPALDCPPLFSVSFEMNSDTPRFKRADLNALVAWLLDHPRACWLSMGTRTLKVRRQRIWRSAEVVLTRWPSDLSPPTCRSNGLRCGHLVNTCRS